MKHDEPIRQHYVPKLYLKRFAIKNNKKYEIYAYDKSEQKLFINVNLKMYSFDHLRMYNFDHIDT